MECRLCLKKSPINCIFSLEYEIIKTIISMFKIRKDDGLSELICKRCTTQIKNINIFFKKCKETDDVLRNKVVLIIKKEQNEASDTEVKTETIKSDQIDDDFNYESDFIKEEFTETKCKDVKIKKKYNKTKKSTDDSSTKKNRVRKKGSYSRDYSEGRLCPYCGMCYNNRDAYSLHLRKHSGDVFQCDLCSRVFNHKTGINRHIKCHMQQKRFSCRFCDKVFKHKHYVRKHEEVVHIKTKPDFICAICGKEFFAKNYLRVHMLIHTGLRNIQCQICSKTFLRKSALNKHLAYHSDDRPFVCRFCPNGFKNSEHRKKHERLHTGETPHKCPICLKGFAQKCNMRSHFVHNHKELDYNETMAKFQKSKTTQRQSVRIT